MSMSNSLIEVIQDGRVRHIIMNRPQKRNALNPELVEALKQAFHEAGQDAQTRVIVLEANGPAFSAGADIDYLMSLQERSYDENLSDSRAISELFFAIYHSHKIVIGLVEGPAIAGGCGLTSTCDFIFSVPEATYGYTEVKIGFVPAIVSYFLIRKVGEGKAKELLLTGDIITAAAAKDMGLVYRVLPPMKIRAEVKSFADKLCRETSSVSIAMTKDLIALLPTKSAEHVMNQSSQSNAEMRMTQDFKKGLASFLRKEKTEW